MKYIFIGLIKLYQWTISPLIGDVCRFYPSCSHYGVDALKKYGFFKALPKIIWRLLRCGPWSRGGNDPA